MDETAVAMQAIEIARLMLDQHREHYEAIYKKALEKGKGGQRRERLLRATIVFLGAINAVAKEVEDEKGAH
jgi:hypothetical protein